MPVLTGSVSVYSGATPIATIANPYTGARASGVVLVDTGDQRAIISPALLSQVGAAQVGTKPVIGVDGQPTTAGLYAVDWDLGAGGVVTAFAPGRQPIYTLGMDVSALGVDGLLGRNLLAGGEFHYLGAQGKYLLAIGVPAPAQAGGWTLVLPFLGLFGAGAVVLGALGE